MPRTARIKSDSAIYHIMSRSISEINLFKNVEDKSAYLHFLKDCQKTYSFKLYAYCLMDNHLHLVIDCNGADISKIMHVINLRYVSYFNRKYARHGHLFQDRFKSKIVHNNRYLLALTAYIHNNPSDIPGFDTKVEDYYFSSLGIYLGMRDDNFELLEYTFVLSILNNNIRKARQYYLNLISHSKGILQEKEVEFTEEESEYRSERTVLSRKFNYNDIIDFISKIMNISKLSIHIKNDRSLVKARALLVFLLKNLCNCSCKDICNIIGDLTQSRISKLASIGRQLIQDDNKFKTIIDDFLISYY